MSTAGERARQRARALAWAAWQRGSERAGGARTSGHAQKLFEVSRRWRRGRGRRLRRVRRRRGGGYMVVGRLGERRWHLLLLLLLLLLLTLLLLLLRA